MVRVLVNMWSIGVVLKKARKIGEGKRGTNVPYESFLDTLVILSQDFVQLIVKVRTFEFLFEIHMPYE